MSLGKKARQSDAAKGPDEEMLSDLVAWEAAQRGMPPVNLWLRVIDALEAGAFHWRNTERPPDPSFLDDIPLSGSRPTVEVNERWLPADQSWQSRFANARFQAELDRDPIHFGCGWLKHIIVTVDAFDKWLKAVAPTLRPQARHRLSPRRERTAPARGRARHALHALYGDRRPVLPTKEIVRQVTDWLAAQHASAKVSEDSILRAMRELWPR